MSNNDIWALVLSYGYAFDLLFFVEFLGKKFQWSLDLSRKIIHIGAGLWVWAIVMLFDTWYFGIIPFATFIVLNYIFYRRQSFKQMDNEQSTFGTVYFAISITVLFLLFWRKQGPSDYAPIVVAAVMAMTLGDAFASIFGIKYGKKGYTVFKFKKTIIGSLAMFAFSLIGIGASLWFLSGSSFSPFSAVLSVEAIIALTLISSVFAAFAEGVSPAGTDNLTVPLGTGILLYFLVNLL